MEERGAQIVLKFPIPEEGYAAYSAANGSRFRGVLQDLDNHLRGIAKYGDDPQKGAWAQELRDYLREELDGLDLEGTL